MGKIRIDEVIVVEGKDDTAAIKRAVDAETIETHGFGMSREIWKRLDSVYEKKGLIVFTDPDHAGGNIRKRILEKYPKCKQAFLDRDKATKKGDIGIENAEPEAIIEALSKAKCSVIEREDEFSIQDMDENGLSGRPDSAERRKKLGDILGTGYGNSRTFLKRLNSFGISREEFRVGLEEIDK